MDQWNDARGLCQTDLGVAEGAGVEVEEKVSSLSEC